MLTPSTDSALFSKSRIQPDNQELLRYARLEFCLSFPARNRIEFQRGKMVANVLKSLHLSGKNGIINKKLVTLGKLGACQPSNQLRLDDYGNFRCSPGQLLVQFPVDTTRTVTREREQFPAGSAQHTQMGYT